MPRTTGMSRQGFDTTGCLICWESVKNTGRWTSEKCQGLFERICSILTVDLSTTCKWDFGIEALPFCESCFKTIQQLICFQDKLELIQKEIDAGIQGIRKKLLESDYKFISTDLRIIGFRSDVLGAAHPSQQPPSYYAGNIIQLSCSDSFQIQSSVTNAGSYSSNLSCYPSHGFSNNQEGFTVNSTHCHTHGRPEDFCTAEVVLGLNESNNATDDSSQEMIDDPNDENPSLSFSSHPAANEHTTNKLKILKDGSSSTELRPKCKESSNKTFDTSGNVKLKQSSQSKELEQFSPLKTTKDGRMFYENIEITKNNKGYVCGKCGYNKVNGHTTITLRKMKIHIKGVHFDAYTCSVCNRKFTSSDILNQHRKRAHIVGPIQCEICQRPLLQGGNAMKVHLWTHKNAEEKVEAQALGLEPVELIYRKKHCNDKNHKCPTCGKLFAKPNVMRAHMKIHLPPDLRKDVKCPTCDKMFSSRNNLREHIKSHHEQSQVVRWFHCASCGKKFYKKENRDCHAARHKSNEEKAFACSICNKKFSLRSYLRLHLRNHRPLEDFRAQCDICGLRLLKVDTLIDHRKRLHPRPRPHSHEKYVRITVDINEIQKGLPLDEESTSKRIIKYNKDGTLNEGRERFSPLKMSEDGKLYFEDHEVSKLKGGGFLCVTCGSKFRFKKSKRSEVCAERAVKIHIVGVHRGGYPCQYCGKKCDSRRHLNSHKRKIHYFIKVKCEACGMEIEDKKYRAHLWSHKSQEEMVIALNSGEPIPSQFKLLRHSLARKIDEDVKFGCGDCSELFPTPIGLDDHRLEWHPKTIIMKYRVNKLKKLGTVKSTASAREAKHSNRSNSRRQHIRKEEYASESGVSGSSESDSDGEDTPTRPSTRILRNQRSRIMNTDIEGMLEDAILSLTSLPNSLVNGKDVKIISDEVVSYVSSSGKMKLMSLVNQNDKYESSSENDTSESESEMLPEQYSESDMNSTDEIECKIFPDPNYEDPLGSVTVEDLKIERPS